MVKVLLCMSPGKLKFGNDLAVYVHSELSLLGYMIIDCLCYVVVQCGVVQCSIVWYSRVECNAVGS